MKRKIVTLILIISLFLGCLGINTIASTKSELTNESSELDSKISQTQDEIDEVSADLSEAMQEVKNLITEISSYEQSISDLNTQIEEKETQIAEKENEITEAQNTLDEKQELLDKRLVALYESGETSYIDLLLSSADLTDFLSKYYLISEIATYDTELIESIRTAKTELESAKTELETAKAELETSKSELETEQASLASAKAEKETKVASLTEEEQELEEQLSEFEEDKQAIQAQLAQIAKEEAAAAAAAATATSNKTSSNSSSSNSNSSSNTTTVTNSSASSYGYIFPVAGCSKSNISNLTYPSYSGHTGVDVNINVTGKSVVAVKSGTVVISTALKRSDGTYKSYGEYVVINHHDGTMTLYAHMLAGSRTVSVGDTVSQGQVIGTVGSTGNSTGTHLHFEVRVNGSPVNPIPYLP